jgi:KamA family protein
MKWDTENHEVKVVEKEVLDLSKYTQDESKVLSLLMQNGEMLIDDLSWHSQIHLNKLASRQQRFVRDLEGIPSLTRLRIHTRFPTTSPARVDEELCALLAETRFAPAVVVLHVNHAAELDEVVRPAVRRLRATGAVLLSQSVLLRGVNDSADALAALSEALGALGVVPYYLHLLDRVRGAGHFEVPEAEGVALVRALTDRLPGYLVPRLVREVIGAAAKTAITG